MAEAEVEVKEGDDDVASADVGSHLGMLETSRSVDKRLASGSLCATSCGTGFDECFDQAALVSWSTGQAEAAGGACSVAGVALVLVKGHMSSPASLEQEPETSSWQSRRSRSRDGKPPLKHCSLDSTRFSQLYTPSRHSSGACCDGAKARHGLASTESSLDAREQARLALAARRTRNHSTNKGPSHSRLTRGGIGNTD